MECDGITCGMSHSASVTADVSNMASTVHSGGMEVFSTPSMIALMERAAFECVENCLGSGKTTVGTMVNVEHLAASAVGSIITATATVESLEGRKICFSIHARDDFGEIGRGVHTRFIVDKDRFMSKTIERLSGRQVL